MKNSIGFCDADLNDDERDPTWLLNKGNDFYGKGNYLAAISAYSSGLCIAKESPSLYLARAEAHFQLGNYKRCVCNFFRDWSFFSCSVLCVSHFKLVLLYSMNSGF